VLAKVDVDTNQQVAQAFQVQGIPAVYALRDGKVVDGFVGAVPEDKVREFVNGLLPSEEEGAIASLLAAGDEASLRTVLEREPGHSDAIVALAELLVARDDAAKEEALALLARIPETAETRRVAALARVGPAEADEVTDELDALLATVKDDEASLQRFRDLLEVLGPDDPRTADYRKQLSARLF